MHSKAGGRPGHTLLVAATLLSALANTSAIESILEVGVGPKAVEGSSVIVSTAFAIGVAA